MTWALVAAGVTAAVGVYSQDKSRKAAHKQADKEELMAKRADDQAAYESGKNKKKNKQQDRSASLLGNTEYSKGSQAVIQ